MPRLATPGHIWIPKNPAERAEALSAEIISGDHALPNPTVHLQSTPDRTAPGHATSGLTP